MHEKNVKISKPASARLRQNGLAPRGDSNASGSWILPSLGEMLVECVEDHNREVSDRRMWAVSGDNDDDNSLVTSGSLSSDLGEEWKKWCVDDPDWERDA